MSTTRTYPGMCDDSLEIFFHEETKSLKSIYQGKTINYHELPKKATAFLDEIINREPETADFLQSQFPNNIDAQKELLAKCRFGGLNLTADFSDDSKSTNDYRNCQKRGNCIGENIICHPIKINGIEVSELEINLLKELATDKKNEAIASDLNLPLGTFNVTKTSLYRKLEIYNKPQSVFILMKEGLL